MFRIISGLAITALVLTSINARSQQKEKFEVVKPEEGQETFERELQEYNSIQVTSGIEVLIDSAQKAGVTIEGAKNFLALVETNVKGNTLIIGITKGKIVKGISVRLPLTAVQKIEATGGAKVISNSTIAGDEVTLLAAGGGSIKLALKSKKLTCEALGGGEIFLNGVSDEATMITKSGGRINAIDLRCRKGRLSLRDGSQIDCQFHDSISVSTDQSPISLRGSPSIHFEKKPKGYSIRFVEL